MLKKLYILFLLIATSLLGQVFPVQVTPQLIPPYSLTIPEYTNANREQLILNLLLTDISELNRTVTLRFSLTSTAGFSVESAPVVIGALPINLSGGVPLRLTNADLQPYFEFQNLAGISPDVYGRPLPDGLYQFCFEVFDGLSGQQISRQSCATAFLVLNDPPFLNTPSKGEIIAEQNPQNIIFQWTPRHLNATNVEYEFTLVELWDELQDPQASFLAGMPYYQTTTRATTLLYGPGEPGLLANKNYAWRVRAMVSDGISQASIFKNDGYSEIYYFEYNGECLPPQFAITTPKTKNTQTVQWQGGNYLEYNLQYRKKDGASNEWFDVSAFNEQANIINLEENTTYEYRVGGQCRLNGGFSYGNINEFTTAESNAEAGGYECGILPDIQITNQEPLPRLGVNDVFTAGDFPVTVKAVTSSNAATGNYSGVGYITVPYLADTRIAVVFENVKLNSDFQLIDGIVETDYDPTWSSVDDISNELDAAVEIGNTVTDVVTLGVNATANAITDLVDSIREQLSSNYLSAEEQQEVEGVLEELVIAKEAYDSAETDEDKEVAAQEFEEAQETVEETIQENQKSEVVSEEDSGEEFIIKELSAVDSNNDKRIANNEETLYLIKNTKVLVSNDDQKRGVKYSLIIEPNLSNFEEEDIVWEYNDFNGNRKYEKGIISLQRNIYENDSKNTTKVVAGKPEKSEKNIDIKWFEEDYNSDNLTLDFGKLEIINNALKKLNFPTYTTRNDYENAQDAVKVLLSPKYTNERKNIESLNNRLYFKETKNIINLSLGISGSIEKPIPSLATPKFNGTFFNYETSFEFGIYWYIGANALGQINATKTSTDWVEDKSKNKISDWGFTDGTNVSLSGNAGLDPKLIAKLGENGVTISGKSNAKIEFIRIDSNGEISTPFISDGVKLSCTPVVNISLGILSYDHKFQKYEYNLKFW